MFKKFFKQFLTVFSILLIVNFTFAQSLAFNYEAFFRSYGLPLTIVKPVTNLFCSFSASCEQEKITSNESENEFFNDESSIDKYFSDSEEDVTDEEVNDDSSSVEVTDDEEFEDNEEKAKDKTASNDKSESFLESLKKSVGLTSSVKETPVPEKVYTTDPTLEEIKQTKVPEYLLPASDPDYRPATLKEIQDYESKTGKNYVPPTSPDYTGGTGPRFTPSQVRNIFNSDPVASKYASQNPAVWDGNPSTQPVDRGGNGDNPVMMNDSNFSGNPNASDAAKRSLMDGRFIIGPDNWLTTKATNFGLGMSGRLDTGLVGFKDGCPTSMSSYSKSGPVRVCNMHTCAVSMPPDVMQYYWGQTYWGSGRYSSWNLGGPYVFKSISQLYSKIAGTPIEVVNLNNGVCTVLPLWDTGPSKKECAGKGCGLDLTYCAKITLQTKSGKLPVKYRPVPVGKRGCEGYKYIPAPVNSTPKAKEN